MIVLGTTLGNQVCSITPRSASIDQCVFHDEIENTDFDVTIDAVNIEAYYVDLVLDFTTQTQLVENRFYMMTLYDDAGAVLLKEKVFCTDQPISTFSVNKGQYISNNSANQFIVLNS
jgi:hypothetical protein